MRRLKIALVLETSGGGSGRHVLDLARGLEALGHAITIIWSPVRASAEFRAGLSALPGIEAHELGMHRAVSVQDVGSLRALTTLVQQLGPFDVIHGHSSKAGALVRLLPQDVGGMRIYTPHAFRTMDPNISPVARRVYGRMERLLARRADRIIAVSAAEHAHALSLGIPASKLVTVVNGVAPASGAGRAAARAAMGLGPRTVAVGFVGRLDAQKDPLRFVDAVMLAARDAPEIRAVVVGDGPLRQEAEAKADRDVVRFMGWQDGPGLMPGFDIYCMTSTYEAMPYTILEAQMVGVPVVATAVGGTENTVIDGETGLLLPIAASSTEIAAALAALAGDAARRAAFASAARQIGQTRTVDRMVRETLAAYEDALG